MRLFLGSQFPITVPPVAYGLQFLGFCGFKESGVDYSNGAKLLLRPEVLRKPPPDPFALAFLFSWFEDLLVLVED